jgi:hypothetical protein
MPAPGERCPLTPQDVRDAVARRYKAVADFQEVRGTD